MRVDQLLPAFHRGDAIGDSAVHMRDLFRANGFEAHIYCLTRDEGLEAESRPFEVFSKPSPGDVTILHYALPSSLTPAFCRLPSKKILVYHNITPAEYFLPFSQEMARLARLGREELHTLVGVTDLGLADSEFNRQELVALGFRRAETFPLFVDFRRYEQPADEFVYSLYKDGRVNILFVGRIVPNKKIEDLIRVVFYFKKYISPLVRLIVVGKTQSLPRYYESVSRLADEFYLRPEEVFFTGHIPDGEMAALYRASDVFLSLSEHEGFCLPLVESMVFDLPVIALATTAVPDTLGGAGILLHTARPDRVGELIDIVCRDQKLREKVLQGQRRRLEEYKKGGWDAFLLKQLESL